jgi:hypothetical protein
MYGTHYLLLRTHHTIPAAPTAKSPISKDIGVVVTGGDIIGVAVVVVTGIS